MSASSSPRSRRVNRRRFLQATAIASAAPMVAGATGARAAGTMQQATAAARAVAPTGADVGSLFPFIQNQAVQGEFPLSFLNPRFRSLDDWKPRLAPSCSTCSTTRRRPASPRGETVERVDCGDYVREKVCFNTTPDLRVPAYVLVPKRPRPDAGPGDRRAARSRRLLPVGQGKARRDRR